MAKFKIDVEIDWLDEDGALDEQIKESMKDEIIAKIEKTVMSDIRDTAVDIAEQRIGLWINKFIQTMSVEKTIPYKSSEYGSKVEMISMEEMLGKQFEKALNQQVDKNGNYTNSSYDRYGTRLQWLTGKMAEKYADEKVASFIKDIKGDIELYTSKKVKEEMMKQLTAQLVKNIDFNKVFKEEI
ncbi:hypothetical protein [Clostridium sp. UBA1652]|uniref:hypothetical protein n=1 Tax=Clostridium sp. UBA1652 TaxID=1946348 RepID=UPI0025807542|nr:hypothetical protein [Clostridium sp. UBA1652]